MKTHLLDSSEPIIEGQTQVAICGASVPNARFVFMWDDIATGGQFSFSQDKGLLMNVCRKCRTTKVEKQYIYGICNGEEMKQRERAD